MQQNMLVFVSIFACCPTMPDSFYRHIDPVFVVCANNSLPDRVAIFIKTLNSSYRNFILIFHHTINENLNMTIIKQS